MKILNDYRNELATLTTDMETILSRTDESGKRSKEDTQAWEEKNERAEFLEAEIARLEKQEARNKAVARNKQSEEDKVAKRFDIGKAITEARAGQLSGLELEMHQEATEELRGVSGVTGNLFIPEMLIKRANEETKTTGAAAGHIPTDVGDLDVVAPTPLYKKIGATVYEDLPPGILELPFSQGHTAAKVAEESAASQSNPTDTKGTLTPVRYQGWQKFTQDYLHSSKLMTQVAGDMIGAVERGIGKALVADAVAANVKTGATTSDTAAVLTWAKVLSLMNEVDGDDFNREAFIMSKAIFYELAATVKKASTDSRMILDLMTGANEGKISGVPSFGTSFLPVHDTNKYDIMFADASKLFVGTWGGVQILVDPYTASDNGYVKITFSRMAAVDTNPYGVASIRNAKLA